jgi:predicted SAM-dependent methyltransferase
MKIIYRIANRIANRISPEVADHLRNLAAEISVAFVHRKGVKKCQKNYKDASSLKVNFGSGSSTKSGFVNLDYSPKADVRLDLRRPVPLEDSCCRLTYSEHFVEHLAYPDGVEVFFSECFRILEAGGEISISVPDTEWPLKEYTNGLESYLSACQEHKWHPPGCTTFMEHINYHFRQRWRGRSYSHFENHRFAWDFETMKKKLLEAGFENIYRRSYDPDLDSAHREVGSLFVKASKPEALGEQGVDPNA